MISNSSGRLSRLINSARVAQRQLRAERQQPNCDKLPTRSLLATNDPSLLRKYSSLAKESNQICQPSTPLPRYKMKDAILRKFSTSSDRIAALDTDKNGRSACVTGECYDFCVFLIVLYFSIF